MSRVSELPSIADHIALRNVKIVIGIAFFVKLLGSVFSDPVGDEAYYWIWSQHPALSYFDHPPLIAVVNFFASAIFGDTIYALRIPPLLSVIGIFLILRKWCFALYGDAGQRAFLVSVALFIVMPGFNVYLSYATPDPVFLFLCFLSLYLFSNVLTAENAKRPIALGYLYSGALALGLAGLTKYYAVFIGFALILVVVIVPAYRSLLRSYHFWFAAVLALACQAPVLIWNYENEFVSFVFQLASRHKSGFFTRFQPVFFLSFIGQLLAFTSPVMFAVLWRFVRHDPEGGQDLPDWVLTRWVFVLSALVFTTVSLTGKAWGWWMFVGVIAAAPFYVRYIPSVRLFWIHVIFGMAINCFHVFSQLAGPVTMLVGISQNPWEGAFPDSDRLKAAIVEVGVPEDGFIGSVEWADTSMVGLLAKDPNPIALLPIKLNAFRYWQDIGSLRGKSALVVLRKESQIRKVAKLFEEFELKKTIIVERFGEEIKRYNLYIGTNFKGQIEPSL